MKKRICLIIVSMFILLQLISFIKPNRAQSEPPTLEIDSSFLLSEYADDIGEKGNKSSVEIDLPSSTWNLSSININFSSIKMGSETLTIEDEESGFETIRNNNFEILGMQLNITEQTLVFAVELFGYKYEVSSYPGTIYTRIEGWNSNQRRPNGIIYGEQIELNMTEIPGWHIQNFSSPINLSPGFYCLVIDGSDINYRDKYYWYINDQNLDSSLYMCRYDEDEEEWQNRQGDVFLHKIKRRVNKSYNPEDINMTARIDNYSYSIQNGGAIGRGILSVPDLNFSPGSLKIDILILNNISVQLIMDYSYHISIINRFKEKATGFINQDSNIEWSLRPTISRFSYNHSVLFNFPKTWFNFSVLRNNINITSLVSLNYSTRLLNLPNTTIINGASWIIRASSPNIDIQLNIPKRKFGPQQDILFSIQEPVMAGNYTIMLYNSLGFQIDMLELQMPGSINLYQYRLSSNPEEGIYRAYTFWNNATDAGLKVYEFQIEVPFTVPIEMLYGILILVSVIIVSSVTSFVLVKRNKKIKTEKKQKIYNHYMDTLNLNYLIVSTKKSGLSLYEQNFSMKKVNAAMISGFLQAIHTFGIQLIEVEDRSQTIKLEYQNSIILMSEFVNLRLILMMKDNPSSQFLYSVESLAYDIYKTYGKAIDDFKGEINQFRGIEDLIKRHLNVSFLYPLKIAEIDIVSGVRMSQNEKSIVNQALKIMEQKNSDYFYVSNLFGEQNKFHVKDAENILRLIKKNVFLTAAISKNNRISYKTKKDNEMPVELY